MTLSLWERPARQRQADAPGEGHAKREPDRAKPEEKARVSRLRQTCDPHLLLRLRPDGLALRAPLSQRERGAR